MLIKLRLSLYLAITVLAYGLPSGATGRSYLEPGSEATNTSASEPVASLEAQHRTRGRSGAGRGARGAYLRAPR